MDRTTAKKVASVFIAFLACAVLNGLVALGMRRAASAPRLASTFLGAAASFIAAYPIDETIGLFQNFEEQQD